MKENATQRMSDSFSGPAEHEGEVMVVGMTQDMWDAFSEPALHDGG